MILKKAGQIGMSYEVWKSIDINIRGVNPVRSRRIRMAVPLVHGYTINRIDNY